MRGKLWFALGAAAGYVIGARAGRERYEQIALTARKLWDHPTVQEAAGVVQAQVGKLYDEGKDAVSHTLSNTKLGEKLRHGSAEPLTPAGAGSRSGADRLP
ncbi:hypothetical protein GCM10010123_02510 [Pilimelia anulata]|uniref:YtxH domain-containing protein n=1 Tax=Pilimelia anulata TaxID=53371 RepID=A0A8J3AZV0_9ACTN|nr:YtxH domain-containing protein [Pilimelia anulata]GGJ76035.1 hypothetical protein GCM10010123_02510 [Pilimelia anulata]